MIIVANSSPPTSIRVEPLAGQPSQSGLTLEAHTPLQIIYEAPETPDLLRQTLGDPLTWQLRNESSILKVILSPNLAPQFVAALLALGHLVAGEVEQAGVQHLPHLGPLLQPAGDGQGRLLVLPHA